MANPKRKQSKARTQKRRAHHALKRPALSICPHCGAHTQPHRVCAECGRYHGREVVEAQTE